MATEAEIAAQLATKVETTDPTPPATQGYPEPPKPESSEDENFHNNLPLENTLENIQ